MIFHIIFSALSALLVVECCIFYTIFEMTPHFSSFRNFSSEKKLATYHSMHVTMLDQVDGKATFSR